jgi:hypothetical protein
MISELSLMRPVSEALLMLDDQLHPDRDTIASKARIAQAFNTVQRGYLLDHLANHPRLKIARIKINNLH